MLTKLEKKTRNKDFVNKISNSSTPLEVKKPKHFKIREEFLVVIQVSKFKILVGPKDQQTKTKFLATFFCEMEIL